MKKIIIIAIILISPFISSAQRQLAGFTALAIFPIGDNTEEYDIGYSFGASYELGLGNYFGVEAGYRYSYIHAEYEDALPFFGIWIDNYTHGIYVMPKLYLPIGAKFRLFAGAAAGYEMGYTRSIIYSLVVDASGNFDENTLDEKQNNSVATINPVLGLEMALSEKLRLSLQTGWKPINMKTGDTTIDIDRYGYEQTQTDISNITAGLKISYILK